MSTPAGKILPRHRINAGVGGYFLFPFRCGKIAVEKVCPQGSTYVQFAFACTVVGNEEAQTFIRDQMHVAMKIIQISAMANDAVPIPTLLIKA